MSLNQDRYSLLLVFVSQEFFLVLSVLSVLFWKYSDKWLAWSTKIPTRKKSKNPSSEKNADRIEKKTIIKETNSVDYASSTSSSLENQRTSSKTAEEKNQEENSSTQPRTPEFPFLEVTNLSGTPHKIQCNSAHPIKVENEFMEGTALIMVRCGDPRFRHIFDKKKRRFEIHFQIKLKKNLASTLMFGGEVPQRMKLNVVTRALCKGVLAAINALSSSIHASFGTFEECGKVKEYPHIVFPLLHAADRLVVNIEGETLPKIGQPIPETDGARTKRYNTPISKSRSFLKGDILTFSFNSMYLDILKWKLVDMGPIPGTNLSTFWNTMPLIVSLYTFNPATPKKHLAKHNKYLARVEVKNTWHLHNSGDKHVVFNGDGVKFKKHRRKVKHHSNNDGINADTKDDNCSVSTGTFSSHSSFDEVESKREKKKLRRRFSLKKMFKRKSSKTLYSKDPSKNQRESDLASHIGTLPVKIST